jgi:lysophospholipase L1-like esterase
MDSGLLFSQSNPDNPLCVSARSAFPSSFTGVKPNIILDSSHCLFPVFEKLMALRNPGNTEKPVVRIVQIGDSHVRSHEFTPAFSLGLTENFGNAAIGSIEGYHSEGILEENGSPGVVCDCIGINGATSQNFLDDKYLTEIQQIKPDLIIISLGTNESIGNYNSSDHYSEMEALFSSLRNYCPNIPILYTTPSGSYRIKYAKYRRHRRVYRRVVSVRENTNTKKVAATINRFAVDHGAACWDLFNIAGGEKYACENWLRGNYFQRDRIHFVSDGYALQGRLLYEALMKGYNEYIQNRHE